MILLSRTHQPEPVVVAPAVRIEPVAIRNPTIGDAEDPTAATKNAPGT